MNGDKTSKTTNRWKYTFRDIHLEINEETHIYISIYGERHQTNIQRENKLDK